MSHHKLSELYKTDDFKNEKHVPVIDCPDKFPSDQPQAVTVTLGKDIAHPNTTEHHIRWIELYFLPDSGKAPYELGRFEFAAHGESVHGANEGPVSTHHEVTATIKTTQPGMLYATAYCNIHGLWESSKSVGLS